VYYLIDQHVTAISIVITSCTLLPASVFVNNFISFGSYYIVLFSNCTVFAQYSITVANSIQITHVDVTKVFCSDYMPNVMLQSCKNK